MLQNIRKRLIIAEINKYLSTDEIVILHGARQVGKTSILFYLQDQLKEKQEKTYFIDLEDSRYLRILETGVPEFIKHLKEEGFGIADDKSDNKKIFIFIDEIQYLSNPSSFLKIIADHHPQIKLIVSGSSSFNIKNKFKDSLVGRTVDFEIFDLSFTEFLDFKDYYFNVQDDYTEKKINELSNLYEEYSLYGGYPKIVLTPELDMKEKYLQQIIDTYIKKDIRDLAEIKDINKFNQMIEVLASQSGQLLNVTELSNTIKLSKPTIERYLFLLEQTYIIRLVRPYHGNLRSEISKTAKVFFYDSGLMQMLWLKQLSKELLGQIFETSVFSELVKKYGVEKIAYWRSLDKKEIDFILKVRECILPIEVKINFAQFRDTAVSYFMKKHKSNDYKIVGLKGKQKNDHEIYPWQV